jgi:glycosyltransferase involved in cell wall biosynthesis
MKFAFITPRYGADIPAGAEHACRLLAEQVCTRHDVDVLTTCARDAESWKSAYSEGSDRVRGVLVRRFAVSQTHDAGDVAQFTRTLLSSPHTRADELEWVRRRGPWSPGLIDFIKRQHRSYDALVFFSLWHPTTVHGINVAPDRSVLFPHLELQATLRFGLWEEILSAPRAVGFMSASERRLARGYVRATPQNEETVGIGVDPPPQQTYPRHQQDPADTHVADDEQLPLSRQDEDAAEPAYLESRGIPFRRRNRLYGRFALYGGRVEPGNGSEEMLEYFDSYAATDEDTQLVLMGAKMMRTPDERYLTLPGVLPDRERMVAFEAADVTIAPAADDLLAQTVLESFAVGTPVLASARNEAAVEHCRRAGAGLYYANREEFVEALRVLITNTRLRERLAESGRAYIQQHHRWDAVLGRFDRLIAKVKGR